MKDELCPCGSGKSYTECCQPIIAGTVIAKTAESLMRSRYAAYVMHEIDHISNTCVRETEDAEIDMEETRRWSEESQWQGLKIISTQMGGENDTEGVVEFSATYTRKGFKDVHLEQAHFKKENGKWLYSHGSLIPTTIIRSEKKVGRNEKCPCGSGKKYKQCCGK